KASQRQWKRHSHEKCERRHQDDADEQSRRSIEPKDRSRQTAHKGNLHECHHSDSDGNGRLELKAFGIPTTDSGEEEKRRERNGYCVEWMAEDERRSEERRVGKRGGV